MLEKTPLFIDSLRSSSEVFSMRPWLMFSREWLLPLKTALLLDLINHIKYS